MVGLLQVLPDETVVVDLAIDGERDGLVGVGEGLGAALYLCVRDLPLRPGRRTDGRTDTDDAEPLMAKDCEVVSGVTSCRPVRNQCILVLWETTLPPAMGAMQCVSQPLCCGAMCILCRVTQGTAGRGGGDALQSGPLCRMLRDKRGQFAPSRLQIGDPGSIGSHIRLGQLQSRRLELEHIRVAMRRVSKGNGVCCARRLGIGELSGGRADGGAIVAPPCTAPALVRPKVRAAPTDASHEILTCGRRRCRTS